MTAPGDDDLRHARMLRVCLALLMAAVMAACGRLPGRAAPPPRPPVDIDRVPDAQPRPEPLSKYGNPPFYFVNGQRYDVLNEARGYVERGIASWYGGEFHGRRTSSGETYDMYRMTAAHRTLPIPCYVEVVNLQNGRRAVLKVNDRGPFKDNRIVDLSYVAARKLGIWANGTGLVEVRVIDPAHPYGRPGPASAARVAATPEVALPFFVQVGAFLDRANAERLRERLQRVAASVRVSPAESSGLAVYRVQIGPLTSVETSDQIVRSLHRIGVVDHRIVLD
ncbi:MAG: septal ring lytic transglycosylase RlpA family protein [Chromatiales bacterium]